jgi:hypothetical protein
MASLTLFRVVAAGAIGMIAWTGQLWTIPLSILVPCLIAVQPSRSTAVAASFAYYAAASLPVIGVAKVYWPSNEATAVLMWMAAPTLLSVPWFLCFTRLESRRPWTAAIAVALSAVPPLCIIGWASPLLRKRARAVINSEHSKPTPAAQEKLLKRRRFQKGSLQLRRRGKAKKWVVLYRDDGGHRRYHTLGAGSMTKADATTKRDEFMRTVNGSGEPEVGGIRPVLLREFIDQKYLPFQRGKWKKSTQGTSENRIMHHVVKVLGDTALKDFSLSSLQGFLESKANEGLSFSVVDHLRWDLSAIFEMAVAEK